MIKDVHMLSSSTKFRPYHISSECDYNHINNKDNVSDLLIQTFCMCAYLCELSQRIECSFSKQPWDATMVVMMLNVCHKNVANMIIGL